jgi:hypothetical protein
MREDFQVGAKVVFKDPQDNDKWFLKCQVGQIIEARAYGPKEVMATVDFNGRRAHVPHTALRLIETIDE